MTRHPATTHAPDRPPTPLRENVAVHDITDCLIEAYDCVARLAYEKFVARGAHAGGELDDWLTAEHELLDNLPADIQDSGESITALVSVPGLNASQIKIGIESRWLVIVSRRSCEGDQERTGDTGRNVRAGDSSTGSEHRTDESDTNSDARDADSRDPDSDDPEDQARDEIEAEKVAEFSRAVHGSRQRERNGAGSIAPSDDLHGRRRILDVTTFVGRTLTGEPPNGEGRQDDSSSRAAARDGESSSGEVPGRGAINGSPSKRPPHLFAILELPAEVDVSRAVAILADGLLGLRMPKKFAPIE